MAPLVKLAWSIVTASIFALSGWVYSTSQRVVAVETHIAGQEKQLGEIHEDVRELRKHLLGDKRGN